MRKKFYGLVLGSILVSGLMVSGGYMVEASSLRVNKAITSVYENKTVKLKVLNNTSKKKVTWSSSNKKVATVTKYGTVKGKKAGTVYIKAKVGGKTVRCKVTVKKPALSKTKVSTKIGSSTKLKVNGGGTVVWSSSDKKIATVTKYGNVYGKKPGTVYITAKVNGRTLKCKVTVKKPTLSKTSLSMKIDDKVKLKVDGATSVTWSSSNKKVARVTSYGNVYGKDTGTAYIYAKAHGVTLKCKVVVKKGKPVISTKTMTLESDTEGTLSITNTNSTVTWSSSNKNIVEVVPYGKEASIVPKKLGTATVTAKVDGYTLTCKVKVVKEIVEEVDNSYSGEKLPDKVYDTNDPKDFWKKLSDKELEEKVLGALVWKNEVTGETYKGVKGLKYGWNCENDLYGGLELVKNPYDVDLSWGFYEGNSGSTTLKVVEAKWVSPDYSKVIKLSSFKISVPKALSYNEAYKLWEKLGYF